LKNILITFINTFINNKFVFVIKALLPEGQVTDPRFGLENKKLSSLRLEFEIKTT
jgi:hypothetical protein